MGGRGIQHEYSPESFGVSLSEGEKMAIGDYQASDLFNTPLRDNLPLSKFEGLEQDIKDLDSAIEKNSVSKGAYFRVVDKTGVADMEAKGAKEGSVFKDKGFLSISKTTGIKDFTEATTGKTDLQMIKILVPEGSKGIDVNKALGEWSPNFKKEEEIILPRNQNYRIEKWTNEEKIIRLIK